MATNLRDRGYSSSVSSGLNDSRGYPSSYTKTSSSTSSTPTTTTTKKATTSTASTPTASMPVPVATSTVTSAPVETVSYGGGGGGGGVDTSAEDEAKKRAQAAAKAAMLSAYAANNSYQTQLNDLNKSLNNRRSILKSSYNNALNTLLSDYDLSKGNINNTASDSLKQAYITNMMNQRNLKQKLASQGLTGGATESTVARLLNAYGNNRNSINSERSRNLSSLENNYNTNRNSALSNYNNALAQLEAENFAERAKLQTALNDRLYSAVNDYAASGAYDDDVYKQLYTSVLNPFLSNNNAEAYKNFSHYFG